MGMEPAGWITLAAVLVALGIGVSSIRQTNKLKKAEKRERLLDEIIDWALEIQTNALRVEIPLDSNLSAGKMRKTMEANSLFRYGSTFTKNDYIMAIANEGFKRDLQTEVVEAISIFSAFLFLKGTSFGMKNIEKSFGGEIPTSIMDELKKEIKDNPKKLEELLEDYSTKMALTINTLLNKIAKIKARDIS
jgi:hypothetical protein